MRARKSPGTDHIQLPIDDLMRVESCVTRVSILSDNQVRTAAPGQGNTLRNCRRYSCTFDHEIRASPSGLFTYLYQYPLRVVCFDYIDMGIADTCLCGQFQSVLRSSHNNHARGACQLSQ